MKYFTNIKTVEELKKQYFALAKKYHPDTANGSKEIMQEINAEYEALFPRYKDIHQSIKVDSPEDTYTAAQETAETAHDFITIISMLLNLGGLDIELCGRWLWIGGNTKEHKEALKALGCKWSKTKALWSWHYPEDSTRNFRKKGTEMSEIRAKYGSLRFSRDEAQLLLA